MSEKPKTVTVEATEYHSHDGKFYDVGDTYELEEGLVENIVGQRKARVVDEPKPAAAKKSQPVEPMTTESFSGGKKK